MSMNDGEDDKYRFRSYPPDREGLMMIIYGFIKDNLSSNDFTELQERYFEYRDKRHAEGKIITPFYVWMAKEVDVLPTKVFKNREDESE